MIFTKNAPLGLAPRNTLIVEDHPVFQKKLRRTIQTMGSTGTVHLCETGLETQELLKDSKLLLDLALIDLGLPDMSGIEVIRLVRNRFPKLPIMVVSVVTEERSVIAAIRAGAKGYILKDDSEALIAQAVSHILAGEYPISPSLAFTLFKMAGAPQDAVGDLEFNLSPRELETLQFISKGHTYDEVGRLMGISVNTVQTHIRSIYSKLDVRTQGQAVTKAREAGLL
jgi:two-component system, NarL family, nitrate/nitrite response regulator NarL